VSAAIHLRVENLSKRFAAFAALNDVSLEIAEGEFVCFLGPSGCGKTTLLRIIAGLETQSEGRIWQRGRDISELPAAMRDFGIVFQSYALFPNLTAAENIAYGLENAKTPRAQIAARVGELLSTMGLAGQEKKYPAQLSGGQQQRVALARALAVSPALLLLDEPLSALDAKVRLRLRRELRDLQRRLGVTTIMVTHDQEEALTTADRIVVMNRGRIEQTGAPEEIYGAPASAFVADFIGAMNFFSGEVRESGLVRVGGGDLPCDTGEYKPGDAVVVAFRPEDVTIAPPGAPGGLRAVAQSAEFLGAATKVPCRCAACGDTPLLVELPTAQWRELRGGGEMSVIINPKRIRLFAARAAA
jgi:iron(III) transport system ATP-binding protein